MHAKDFPVECAFSSLKTRWTKLTRKIGFKLKSAQIPCFVLHNFCEFEFCHLVENLVRMQIERNKAEEEKSKNIPYPV